MGKILEFDNLNDIREHITLVKLMYTAGNVNNFVSIYGHWIYDSNYKRVIHLIEYLLGFICSQSKHDKGLYANYEKLFYAARYVNPKAKLEKSK